MTTIDRKKELRAWYSPSPEPELVPELGYLMIDGEGDPETALAHTSADSPAAAELRRWGGAGAGR